LWDGHRLPGPWLTLRALDAAATMAAAHGTGTVVIRRAHHIACLASYLLRATERGLVAIVQSSDPIVAAVVPHGDGQAVAGDGVVYADDDAAGTGGNAIFNDVEQVKG
jgi:L-lactate dehydrogenase